MVTRSFVIGSNDILHESDWHSLFCELFQSRLHELFRMVCCVENLQILLVLLR
jgi:hypothetical protein